MKKIWLKVPSKISKAVDVEKEEDLGIPAGYTDGWALVAIEDISYMIGDTDTSIYLKSGGALLIELSISEISLLLEE